MQQMQVLGQILLDPNQKLLINFQRKQILDSDSS